MRLWPTRAILLSVLSLLAPLKNSRLVLRPSRRGLRRGWPRLGRLLALLCALSGLFFCVLAQADTEDGGEPDTPRRALERFIGAVHEGRFADAAKDLELPENKLAGGQSSGVQLARWLGAVLDRRLSSDPEWLSKVSDAPMGDLKDGISNDQEEVGRLPGAALVAEPVRMRRIFRGGDYRWVFSAKTVSRVPSWYQRLDDLWLREHLPTGLLRIGPRGFVLWEWLALPILLATSVMLALLLTWLLRLMLTPLLRRTQAKWDQLLVTNLRQPMRLILSCVLWGWAMPHLLITVQAERSVQTIARVGLLLGLFWALWRCIDVVVQLLRESVWMKTHPAALGVVPLGYRLAEIAVAAIAIVTALQELGYPVTSLVAGLGIGGLAVALAAQKTVEHVFGGVMLSIDQPMRVGDYVRIEDTTGWVEQIGLRSTSIRTLDRSLVTIPNGKLAEMKIESMAARDRMRMHLTLGVTYDESPERMAELRDAIHAYLKAHPLLWHDMQLRVHFVGFGDSALNIDIMAWFQETDWDRFLELRHVVLLELMRIVERHGAQMAFPTQTIHLVKDQGPQRKPGR